MTSKEIKHLNLRENMVSECHQSEDVDVKHIPGIINPSDIFKKYMKDNTHFRNIRDSMMVSLQAFLEYSHNVPSHMIFPEKNPPQLLHMVGRHSYRHSRTQIKRSRTHYSKNSGTPIGSQTDCIKMSSLNFSQQRGVDRN